MSLSVMAHIVDFCPTNGCLWPSQNLSFNVDVYGEKTWVALGGGLDEGVIDIEILWNEGMTPVDSWSRGVGRFGESSLASLTCLLMLWWMQ